MLAKAQEIREQEDADYAEKEHMRKALDKLGIEYEVNDLPGARSGTAGL